MNKNLALRTAKLRSWHKTNHARQQIRKAKDEAGKENLRSWWINSSTKSSKDLMALTPRERGTPGEMYQPGFVYRGNLNDLPAGWRAYESPDPSLGLTDYHCVHYQGVPVA